ncbi:hypothetical protein KBC51_00655 [Candidatus Saccharibacteria bacterium]|nr:hypothetical protein [Candidatus Saccharibacteria bacterium]
MIDRLRSDGNYYRAEYWKKPGVKKAISQFLGSKVLDWSLWREGDVASEFLGLANRDKLQRPDKVSPAIIVEPEDFKNYYEDFNGQFELHNSMWQRESIYDTNYPRRALLVWDIEIFDQHNPLSPIENPEDTFDKLEIIYNILKSKFDYYGIKYQAVASGRGYNFVTSVSDYSGAMDDLIEISGSIETTVLDKQKYPNINLKRHKQVPEIAERLHVASVRLQQFLFNEVIRESRAKQPFAVEVSDKGNYGIAYDNTAMQYSVENRSIGSLGTPYFIKGEKSNPEFTRTVIKVPRKGFDFELTKDELMVVRSNYDRADQILSDADCRVPESSEGIKKLVNDYSSSKLINLHKKMDESFGDDPSSYDFGYRNYDLIANKTENPDYIKHLLSNANDELLKPANIDYFVWEIFKSWGGNENNLDIAPHVAGLLGSIYEDPRYNWGSRFIKIDAQRYARGWVTTVIGQAFEKDYLGNS